MGLTLFWGVQVGQKQQRYMTQQPEFLTLEKALHIAKDAFISATERDIYTGDCIEITILTKDGVKRETMSLKED